MAVNSKSMIRLAAAVCAFGRMSGLLGVLASLFLQLSIGIYYNIGVCFFFYFFFVCKIFLF